MRMSFRLAAVVILAGVGGAQSRGEQGVISWKACLSQGPSWYSSGEALRIADNVLLYQRDSGGWCKNTEMAEVLSSEAKAKLMEERDSTDTTIDNGATCRQLRYLAKMYKATGEERFKDSFLKGLDFLLEAQYENGGWPQFYPIKNSYSKYITFNDGAMINVMRLLRGIVDGESELAFVDAERRTAAKRAAKKGVECILKCQIVVDAKRLAWCAQHDDKTLEPRPARSYERESLSGSESVGVVEYLMDIEEPSPEIIAAIENAVVWFDAAKIEGIRQIEKPALGTPKGYDKVIVNDSEAPPLWARFYQIGTNKAIFCSRDGIIRDAVADISYERRNGYSWYTDAPADLLNEAYPKWARKWTPGRNVLR